MGLVTGAFVLMGRQGVFELNNGASSITLLKSTADLPRPWLELLVVKNFHGFPALGDYKEALLASVAIGIFIDHDSRDCAIDLFVWVFRKKILEISQPLQVLVDGFDCQRTFDFDQQCDATAKIHGSKNR